MGKFAVSLVVSAVLIAVVAATGPLVEGFDLSVAKARIKPASATAGDSIKVTFTVKNAGPGESPAVKANIVLFIESKDKAKAGKGITVKSVDLEPLASATKKKLNVDFEIGEKLAKGSYRLQVVIDAGNSGQDSKPANNTAKCKKLLLVK